MSPIRRLHCTRYDPAPGEKTCRELQACAAQRMLLAGLEDWFELPDSSCKGGSKPSLLLIAVAW